MTEPLPESFGAEGMDLFVGHPDPPEQVPGQHLWVCMLAIKAHPILADNEVHVQMTVTADNLVDVSGPGCFWCDGFFDDVHLMPCPGQPLGGGS